MFILCFLCVVGLGCWFLFGAGGCGSVIAVCGSVIWTDYYIFFFYIFALYDRKDKNKIIIYILLYCTTLFLFPVRMTEKTLFYRPAIKDMDIQPNRKYNGCKKKNFFFHETLHYCF